MSLNNLTWLYGHVQYTKVERQSVIRSSIYLDFFQHQRWNILILTKSTEGFYKKISVKFNDIPVSRGWIILFFKSEDFLFITMNHFLYQNIVPLHRKGCIWHFAKWQIHPFISKLTNYGVTHHLWPCHQHIGSHLHLYSSPGGGALLLVTVPVVSAARLKKRAVKRNHTPEESGARKVVSGQLQLVRALYPHNVTYSGRHSEIGLHLIVWNILEMRSGGHGDLFLQIWLAERDKGLK